MYNFLLTLYARHKIRCGPIRISNSCSLKFNKCFEGLSVAPVSMADTRETSRPLRFNITPLSYKVIKNISTGFATLNKNLRDYVNRNFNNPVFVDLLFDNISITQCFLIKEL